MDSTISDGTRSDDGIASGSSGSVAKASLLRERRRLTLELTVDAYDLVKYLERAHVHSDLGYPDLAAGDAYRALLLCDEVDDESGEYHEQALQALEPYLGKEPTHILQRARPPSATPSTELPELHIPHRVILTSPEQLIKQASSRCFEVLSLSLLLCGCLKSSYDFCKRGLAVTPDDESLKQTREDITRLGRGRLKKDEVDINDLPDDGLVRREIYPWNVHEPDRFCESTLSLLNSEVKQIAPKCEVRSTQLPTLVAALLDHDDLAAQTNQQLGMFATAAIAPGETVLEEYTVLTATNRLQDAICDACSIKLPPLSAESKAVSCPQCGDTMFCDTYCLEQAEARYHPALCDKDGVDTIARDPSASESTDSLYLLLLVRALAMSVTQEVHPLDLTEVQYIWGDFLPSHANDIPIFPAVDVGPPPVWTLPFSFATNITGPLHVLERMDVDIWTALPRFDLWIFNTLHSKFRGTASARVDERNGRPEVAAVHSLWCLANHDCDPNVEWSWAGRMKLWCREQRIGGRAGGIAAGEEILNHYCDVELHVNERREWAKGSLGGDCMCNRCVREAGEDHSQVEGRLDGYVGDESM